MEIKRPNEDTRAFDWFATNVVAVHTGVSVGHSHLVRYTATTLKADKVYILVLVYILVAIAFLNFVGWSSPSKPSREGGGVMGTRCSGSVCAC
jgi:hypothetical protein